MNFKEWLMQEAGHLVMHGPPQSIMVMLHGQPSLFHDVSMIDPRFELNDIPHPRGQSKFLGDSEYSLPLVKPTGQVYGYIVSKRGSMMSGVGFMNPRPQGVVAPINWADHAIIINSHGQDLVSNQNFKVHGGEVGSMRTNPAIHSLSPVTVRTQDL